ncbi:MAG: peroxiredoxin family protein, partial [Planctomycetota bacterium]
MLAAPLFAVAILAAPVPHYENDEPLTAPPKVGQEAPDFTLPELGEKEPVMLSTLSEDGPVVLMVLRGYPGYQCPICSRQVGAYLREAEAFEKLGAKVVMIYPGPEKNLQRFAREFAGGLDLPDGFTFLMDPGYTFANAYKLRWDAPRETAYPST